MNILEMYAGNFDPVDRLMLVEKGNYKVSPDYTFVNPDLIVGLELEIENWPYFDAAFRGFTFHSDGSLRGASTEAVTRPMYSKYVPEKLESFFKKFGVTEENYSERCSVHVHVNCQNLAVEQVAAICLLYQVTERVLFSFIGNERDTNIFCVPWSQCNLSSRMLGRLLQDANYTVRGWQKYTALNLLPLRDRGTIEFRHMEGTCDVKRITTWLNIIGSIVKYATSRHIDDIRSQIASLNTNSNYEMFIYSVFGDLVEVFTDLRANLQQGVIDCKVAMIGANEPVKKEDPATVMDRRFDELMRGAERQFDAAPPPIQNDFLEQWLNTPVNRGAFEATQQRAAAVLERIDRLQVQQREEV